MGAEFGPLPADPGTGGLAVTDERNMGNLPRVEITDRSAWKGADLAADESWIHRFSATEIADIRAAIGAVRSRGLGPFEFGAEDFPLGSFGEVVEGIGDDLENGTGVALLRGFPIDDFEAEEARIFYWGLGTHLGTPIRQNAKGEYMAEVTDRGYDRANNNVRGYTTRQRQRPHCDNADAVGLFCIHPAKSGGESMIASSITIYNEILRSRPEFLEPLSAGFHFDLRGEGVTGERDEFTHNRVPVFSYFEGRLSCRYNGKTIIDGMEKAGSPLLPLELEAVEYVRELACRDDIRLDLKLAKGDISLLCNHSTVHAREPFEDHPEPARKRRMLRLWVHLANGRALAPEFAERNNTGPRGGVAVTEGAGYWAGA
jgi:hypothetical protein